jgi:hypothetical protein
VGRIDDIEFPSRYKRDLEEVVMETDSICYCQSTVHSNEEVMRYHQEIVSIDWMINREFEVE